MRRPHRTRHVGLAGTLLALMITCCAGAPRAQGDPFDRYATRPDQWRPATPAAPGVDARGDLNLDVPVMTVPGRAGLGFDVRLTYQSGVRYADRGSWVGTGWRFDPGSITRDVFGILATSGAPANVDFATAPTLQPDAYYVTMPGAAAAMVRHAGAPGTVRPIRQDSSGFYVTEWRPWRISARVASPVAVAGQQTLYDAPAAPAQSRADYRRFVVTREDGTRYVFDAPTLATYYGINANLSGRTSEQYVATWRLVSILGPDYQGPEVPTGSEAGAWVRLIYGDGTTAGAVISHVAQDPSARPDGADRAPLAQSMVLMEVMTPTHRAVFSTEPRGLENFAMWEQQEAVVLYRRLTQITLFARLGAETGRVVRRAVLDPAPVGFPGLGNSERRLALGGIRFFGRGAAADGQPGPEAPGYRFDYYRMEDEGGDIGTTDDFGFYTTRPWSHGYNGDPDDGKAWSLRSIVYPSGGWDEFEYANDSLVAGNHTYGRYNAATGASNSPFYDVTFNRTRQGGTRVVRVRRFDAVTHSVEGPVPVVTSYAYGPGRLTAPPPLFWARQYGGYRLYMPQERARAAVYYDHVERADPDGARVVTRYTTPATHPNVVRHAETVLWDWPHVDGGPGGTGNPGGIRAAALAQGNQEWAWGHVYEVEYRNPARVARRVRRTLALSGYEPLAGGPVPRLAIAWATGVAAHVEWSYGPRVLHEEERDISATGVSAGPTTEYTYFDQRSGGYPDGSTGNGLLRAATDVRDDGRRRRRQYTYGSEAYSQLSVANRLSPVVREDLVELDAAANAVAWHAASVTRWRSTQAMLPGQLPFGPTILFAPHETWARVAPAPEPTRAPFDQWVGGQPAEGWQRQQTFEVYDPGALPLRILDGRSFSTHLRYDAAGRVSTVTRETGAGTSLLAAFSYDSHFGLLAAETDENGGRIGYSYDDHGRLAEVRDRSRSVTSTYAYATPRQPDGRMQRSRPNRGTITRWTASNPDRNVTLEFTDGLGRPIQTQVLDDGGEYVVTGRRYQDPVGASRAEQVRVPIRRPTGGEFDVLLGWAGPTSFAPGLIEDQPPQAPSMFQNYTETRYVRDGTGRVQGRTFPNEGTAPIPQHFQSYGAIDVAGRRLRVSWFVDESNDGTETWMDAWGNAIRSVRAATGAPAVAGLTTETDYDVAGRPTTVRSPNYFDPPHGTPAAWVTTMGYDTAGRLTRRVTPDAGEVLFAYDGAGNPRFEQDAARRQQGTFVAIRHDALGRVTRSGVYPLAAAGAATFNALDPLRPYSAAPWEDDATRWLTAVSYDQKPSASTAPWGTFAAQIGAFPATNSRGRTVAAASRSDGAWQLELTAYDAEERIARRMTHTQGDAGAAVDPDLDVDLRFGYDRQGRLITRDTRLAAGSPGFRHWYDYSMRGLAVRIYASTSMSRPAVQDVAYTHMETGAPRTIRRGNAPEILHVYDARDRLVRIGGPVEGAALHAFQGEYLYSPDGDVIQAAFLQRHAGAADTRDYWAYCYDGYDRLQFAARVEGGLPEPSGQCVEPWGVTPDTPFSVADLTYDANGNLKTLARLDATGAVVDRLAYAYQPGTNRLASIADAGAGAGVPWDMEAGPVVHDANGNITQLPAPYAMTAATYDTQNRLLAATFGGREVRYRYGAGGARYMQRSNTGIIVGTELERTPAGARTHVPAALHEPQTVRGDAEGVERSPRPGTFAPRFTPRFAPTDTSRPGGAPAGGAPPAELTTFTAIDAVGLRAPAAVRAPAGDVTYNLLTPAGAVVGRQPAAGARTYDIPDALGSVRAVVDAAGAVVESRAYDAWGLALAGRTTGPASARQGFTGKERDADAGGPLGGLDDFGARSYTPLLGRFLQVDPSAGQFPGWSPYTYTLNRPLSLVDPDGRAPAPPDWYYIRGQIVWREQSGPLTEGGKSYESLGPNVVVAWHARDSDLQEPINGALFELYLDSDRGQPLAQVRGNTVPADVSRYGTLTPGIYDAALRARSRYPNERALRLTLNGSLELPAERANPNNPANIGVPESDHIMTGIFFHVGNTSRTSLQGARSPISEGCLTGFNGLGGAAAFGSFMAKVPDDVQLTLFMPK